MKIRQLEERDLSQVIEISKESFTIPWSSRSFQQEMHSQVSTLKVFEIDGEVAGFIVYRVILDEAEILSIAVKPDKRKRGIATELLKNALEDICKRAKICFLEVRASNIDAIKLYEKLGFKVSSIRKKYYLLPEEDALIMEYKIE